MISCRTPPHTPGHALRSKCDWISFSIGSWCFRPCACPARWPMRSAAPPCSSGTSFARLSPRSKIRIWSKVPQSVFLKAKAALCPAADLNSQCSTSPTAKNCHARAGCATLVLTLPSPWRGRWRIREAESLLRKMPRCSFAAGGSESTLAVWRWLAVIFFWGGRRWARGAFCLILLFFSWGNYSRVWVVRSPWGSSDPRRCLTPSRWSFALSACAMNRGREAGEPLSKWTGSPGLFPLLIKLLNAAIIIQ